ncbi:hypothetical protein [Sphingobium chungbukense]|uniref:Lipoprotein n=1 Tax=Sphingobium chungbukense TaxID=56193 RepID=A0A0M3AQY3_9SPHN|nr:hypothetical protein [Sphingobium chungbukense]KKW92245.1 hypothetical protein YP76_09930 [Sphingobium chungbukense]
MKLGVVIAACVTLAGCMSVQDVRSRPVMFSGSSPKAVNDIAACVTLILQSGKAVMVTATPLKNGVSLTQSVNGQFGNTVFTVADIETVSSGETSARVYAVGRVPKNFDPGKSRFATCM